MKKVGKVAYELELPAELAVGHSVFHILLSKVCVRDLSCKVPLEGVAVKDSLSYEDVPVEILDRQVRRLRKQEVASINVLWIELVCRRSYLGSRRTHESQVSSPLTFRFHSMLK